MLSVKDFYEDLRLGKKLLIFDVDDTLIDTSESYDQAIKETVGHFTGVEVKDKDLAIVRKDGLNYGVNNDWNVTFLLINLINIFPNQNWSEVLKSERLPKIDTESDSYKEIKNYFQDIYLGNPPFGGNGLIDTKEKPMWKGERSQFFEELIDLGFKLAVVTSRPGEETFYTLYEVNKLEKFFPKELVIHADSVNFNAILIKEKPSPEPILEILRLTGNKTSESVYIGNSSSDYVASRDAGVDFRQVGKSEITRDLKKEGKDFVYKKIGN